MQQGNEKFKTVSVLARELTEGELAEICAASGKPGSGSRPSEANIPPSLGNLPYPPSFPANPPASLPNPPVSLVGPNGLIGTSGPGLLNLGALVSGLV